MQPLPSPIHLRQLKNQSKDLRDACRAGQAEALARLYQHHPQHSPQATRIVNLADVQLVIAREHGYDSWLRLVAAAEQSHKPTSAFDDFVGVSCVATETRRLLASASVSSKPVLLIGERGTGKRTCARLLHEAGPQSGDPLQQLTCSGNETIVESNLFGHEVDAFTGARASLDGLLQTGDGGSLLLDEVEHLGVDTQIRMQTYLDVGRFRRLGAAAETSSDVRVIASTSSATLDSLQRVLREDLFYQLSVLVVALPPLRDRPEDVMSLVQHFARQEIAEGAPQTTPPKFLPAAMTALVEYAWPGNVRQLRNTVERAVITSDGTSIGVDQLQLPAVVDLV